MDKKKLRSIFERAQKISGVQSYMHIFEHEEVKLHFGNPEANYDFYSFGKFKMIGINEGVLEKELDEDSLLISFLHEMGHIENHGKYEKSTDESEVQAFKKAYDWMEDEYGKDATISNFKRYVSRRVKTKKDQEEYVGKYIPFLQDDLL